MASITSMKAGVVLSLLLTTLFFTNTTSTKNSCTPSKPSPKGPKHPITIHSSTKCPKDILQFSACGDLLGGVISIVIGANSCCTLLKSLTDGEAVLCLCSAVKGGVFGLIKTDISMKLSMMLNTCGCGNKFAAGYKCA